MDFDTVSTVWYCLFMFPPIVLQCMCSRHVTIEPPFCNAMETDNCDNYYFYQIGNWFFMGIIHKETCGGWVRVRDEKSIDYTNWLESEANKADKPKCTKLGYLGYWESFPCDEEQYFICERYVFVNIY